MKTGTLYVARSNDVSLTQTNASISVSQSLYLANDLGTRGTYTLAGGSLTGGTHYLGNHGNATFLQTGGTYSASTSYLAYGTDATANVTLSAGVFKASGLYVGYGGNASFTQTGGTVGSSTSTSLYVGYLANSLGSYCIDGGMATFNYLYIGNSGNAQMTINPGATVQASSVYLSYNASSTTTFTLSGGSFTVSSTEFVGYSGQAAFTQTAGSHLISGSLIIGNGSLEKASSYVLNGGNLTASGLTIAKGSFTQTGGAVSISSLSNLGNLNLGTGTTDIATYNLSAGSLAFGDGNVGNTTNSSGLPNATFTQSGGLVTANYLTINPMGTYQLSDGSLCLNQGGINKGTLDLADGGASITYGGLLDLTQGSLLHSRHATFSGLTGSILLLPAGFNPDTNLGAYASAGVVHVVGSDLVLPAGTTYNFGGDIYDHLETSASITMLPSKIINVFNGLTIHNALVQVANVKINDARSGIDGGSLSATSIMLGDTADGRFTQTNGSVSAGISINPSNTSVSGTYSLLGGYLKSNSCSVGTTGNGLFQQNGGTHAASSLTLGSQGRYEWSGGSLTFSSSILCRGTFDLMNAPHSLTLGAIANFGLGTIANADQTDLITTPNSLIIFPAGFDPHSAFYSFTPQDFVHYAGSTLTITPGSDENGK